MAEEWKYHMYFVKMFLLVGLSLAFGWRLDDLFRSYACGHASPKVVTFPKNSCPLSRETNCTAKGSNEAEECYEKNQS